MKSLKIAALIVVVLAVALFALNFVIAGASPSAPSTLANALVRMRRGEIGFWLAGDVVKTPVTDWSFVDGVRNIQIQTHTPYLIPHVLTTDIARIGDRLYLFSEYFPPRRGGRDTRKDFPQARFWNRMVIRDPRIRVKIGDRLFDMRVYPLTDPAEIEMVSKAFLDKYDDVRRAEAVPEARRPAMYFFHLEPQWNSD